MNGKPLPEEQIGKVIGVSRQIVHRNHKNLVERGEIERHNQPTYWHEDNTFNRLPNMYRVLGISLLEKGNTTPESRVAVNAHQMMDAFDDTYYPAMLALMEKTGIQDVRIKKEWDKLRCERKTNGKIQSLSETDA